MSTLTKLNFSSEKEAIQSIFEKIKSKTIEIDPSLGKTVLAEAARQIKSVENLESKVMRAEKQKHETSINQLKGLKEKLFPETHLLKKKSFIFLFIFLVNKLFFFKKT